MYFNLTCWPFPIRVAAIFHSKRKNKGEKKKEIVLRNFHPMPCHFQAIERNPASTGSSPLPRLLLRSKTFAISQVLRMLGSPTVQYSVID